MNSALHYYYYYSAAHRQADAVRDSYRNPPRHRVVKPPVPQPRLRGSSCVS
jgi:hypothetical protein